MEARLRAVEAEHLAQRAALKVTWEAKDAETARLTAERDQLKERLEILHAQLTELLPDEQPLTGLVEANVRLADEHTRLTAEVANVRKYVAGLFESHAEGCGCGPGEFCEYFGIGTIREIEHRLPSPRPGGGGGA